MISTGGQARQTVFAPRLQALLDEHRGKDLFRLDDDTVGVASPELMHRILSARYATETERPTFKPLHGRSIQRSDAIQWMQAIGRDVRTALKKPIPEDTDLSGEWPQTGHNYLRDLLLRNDPQRLRALMSRVLELTPKLTWAVIAVGALRPFHLGEDASVVAGMPANTRGYHDRRYAMGLYRRTVAPVCFTISTLVANALWLGSPFDECTPNSHILYEAMRLLPPSWNILRNASPEYPAIDSRIGPEDDVLILPLLSQRDPAIWDAPDTFRPERWNDIDPDDHPAYLPFGHRSERCWGRHMVMPLADMLLDVLRREGMAVSPYQTAVDVPLAGLLGVSQIQVSTRRAH
ncbi:cytochrome P450 [Luteibacter sp. CQ10]|uniref:cytochrome P450 n=1 Tax=Luteibacter sp. CQ10 TaxID=2805821 RepID=UPI0034A49255